MNSYGLAVWTNPKTVLGLERLIYFPQRHFRLVLKLFCNFEIIKDLDTIIQESTIEYHKVTIPLYLSQILSH